MNALHNRNKYVFTTAGFGNGLLLDRVNSVSIIISLKTYSPVFKKKYTRDFGETHGFCLIYTLE